MRLGVSLELQVPLCCNGDGLVNGPLIISSKGCADTLDSMVIDFDQLWKPRPWFTSAPVAIRDMVFHFQLAPSSVVCGLRHDLLCVLGLSVFVLLVAAASHSRFGASEGKEDMEGLKGQKGEGYLTPSQVAFRRIQAAAASFAACAVYYLQEGCAAAAAGF